MKKQLLFFTLILPFFFNAQFTFDKGYFIDNEGTRIDCVIKNFDRSETPQEFEYKLENSDVLLKKSPKSVSYFEIYDVAKYVGAEVDFEKYDSDIRNLDTNKNPNFESKNLFLRIVVDGEYDLFKYLVGKQTTFYYRKGDGKIRPLIYKPYEIKTGSIAYNKQYIDEIEKEVTCDNVSDKLRTPDYYEVDLRKYFNAINLCVDSDYTKLEVKKSSGKFNVYIRPRLNLNNLQFNTNVPGQIFEMDSKSSFGFGLELEYLPGFTNQKLALIFEPSFQTYKAENTFIIPKSYGGNLIANIDYKSLDLEFGFRYYIFIDNKSKFFVNTFFVTNFNKQSSFTLKTEDGTIIENSEGLSQLTLGIGVGYNYNKKISAEIRYNSPKRIIIPNNADTGYQNLSFALGYNIF
ncbi:outer membrane beta-barrel protein [Frigoriflavimonas asaccharolytica]|uniref:Outer membrane protein beta-barrel domain-containing protein n=1 Tax=Frigoriflavimonas asaccharolytica TaxID=2735899 RepID=A0A8J8K9R9_9FLAO|nr:outer membrane beta-barrel protein [Frigoriflavimonas asaccharolytica]NRS93377.1 hypothetical protein [Frigoriflavimonas asaccharolytica]